MTRINVIPVTELCDQHLLAEHRELTRIPNGILSGKLQRSYADAPTEYTLGTGHIKFFVDKMYYLHKRHMLLEVECRYRGFNVTDRFPDRFALPTSTFNDYTPIPAAIALNRARINQRLQTMATRGKLQSQYLPCWTRRQAPDWVTCSLWAHKPV